MVIIIKYVLLCFIVPELLGVLISGVTKNWERPFFCYISGFLAMLAMAYLIYLPIGLTGRSFHRYVQVCLVVYGIWIVLGLALYHRAYATYITRWVTCVIRYVKAHPIVFAFAAIVVMQVLRVIFYTQIHYSDDDTYISFVGDILHSDGFYGINYENGRPLSAGAYVDPKFRYTGWFAFQALLSRVVGVHPLIMVKTLLPVAFILLHYMVIFDLYDCFKGENRAGLGYFFLFYGLLMEFAWGVLTTSWSYYFLTWIWYGKSFLQFIILPLILSQFLRMRWKMMWDYLWVLIVLVAGVGASTMALILLPAEGFLCFVTLAVTNLWKKARVRHV